MRWPNKRLIDKERDRSSIFVTCVGVTARQGYLGHPVQAVNLIGCGSPALGLRTADGGCAGSAITSILGSGAKRSILDANVTCSTRR